MLACTACQATTTQPDRAQIEEAPLEECLDPVELHCLAESLEALREEFNAHSDKPRLVSLLSPGSAPCELGSRAIRESVLEAYPDAELQALVVWVDDVPGTGPELASQEARALDGPRVRQFHDRSQRAGRAFAERLLPTAVAFDVYLFYPPGALWEERPPHPAYWAHQRGRIEPEHFHPREELFAELHRSTGLLHQGNGVASVRDQGVALAAEGAPSAP